MRPPRRDPKVAGVLELLEAIFLGVVQGLTEFLPVSSSGHLLLSQYFLGMDQGRFGLSFDAAIHTGTVLAVVWFFWGDILSMARALLRSLPRPDFSDAEVRMAYLILLATVPAALIGFLFEDFFATEVRSPWVVVFNLVFVGALFLGLRREEAARFSFLMSVPVTAAAAGLSLAETAREGMGGHEVAMFVAGSVSSAVVGYLAIKFLLSFLANHTLRVFAYYRFALAAVVAVVLLSS